MAWLIEFSFWGEIEANQLLSENRARGYAHLLPVVACCLAAGCGSIYWLHVAGPQIWSMLRAITLRFYHSNTCPYDTATSEWPFTNIHAIPHYTPLYGCAGALSVVLAVFQVMAQQAWMILL